MYAKQYKAFSQEALLEALTKFPTTWVLTPINGNKVPYRKRWQSEEPVFRSAIVKDIQSGFAKGVGIRTGRISGGIVAIDFDGQSAWELARQLGEIPITVAFTSGRLGRHQRLYYIPEEYWSKITTKKLKTGVIGDDGKPEQLELRWDGCQSVLPPSAHPETNAYLWRTSYTETAIAQAPMWVIEQMLHKPEPEEKTSSPKLKQPTNTSWTTADWTLSYLNALSPYRADDYDDWLAVGMALHSVDDALLTEWDKWSSQSPKYKPGVCEKKWKSFNSQGISIGSLAHMAKGDGWQSPFNKPTGRSFSSTSSRNHGGGSGGSGGSGGGDDGGNGHSTKVLNHPPFSPLTKDELLASINSLIQQGSSDSEVSLTIPSLAKRSGYTESAIWKIYHDLLKETELEESRTDASHLIDSLLSARQASVPLHSVLPMALADPFTRYASWLNIRPEVILLTFLTTVSGLHHSETTSLLNRDFDFDVKPNLFTAIVAPPSQKKSPILKAIAKKPLRALERKARDEWRRLQSEFNEIRERYNSLPKDQKEQQFPNGLPPEPPDRRKIYSFSDTTTEGIRNQIEAYPNQGLIALPDELARLIKSANKYRGGKGSDEEDLLSYYDGGGETVLRAGGLAGDFDNLLLSILGSIQPGVLQKMLKDCQDENGKWARFIFVSQPLAPSVMSADGGSFDLAPMLANLYEKVNNLFPEEYKPSREAFNYYCSVYNEFERRRCEEPHTGLSAAWGKAEGRVGKIACNLHVVHELVAGKIPSTTIPKARYQEAFDITMFGMQQLFSLYKELGEEDALASHLIKVITLSQEKGGFIKAKEVQALYCAKYRPTPDTVRSWFRELEAMGKGTTRGNGRSLEFSAVEKPTIPPEHPQKTKVDKVDILVDVLSTAEKIDIQGVQPKVDKVDISGCFLEKTHQYVETPHSSTLTANPGHIEKEEKYPPISTSSTNAQDVDGAVFLEVDTTSTETSTFGETSQALVAAPFSAQQLREADYSSFPVNNPRMTESVRGTIAGVIRNRILEIDSPEAYEALRDSQEFTTQQLNWVRRNLLTQEERATFQAKVLGSTPSNGNPPAQPERLFKNGDRVQHKNRNQR
jgi:uncharacterized membrane protein YgcG